MQRPENSSLFRCFLAWRLAGVVQKARSFSRLVGLRPLIPLEGGAKKSASPVASDIDHTKGRCQLSMSGNGLFIQLSGNHLGDFQETEFWVS
jgi:hypothetical protein